MVKHPQGGKQITSKSNENDAKKQMPPYGWTENTIFFICPVEVW